MPRRSHVKVSPGESDERIVQYELTVTLPKALHDYLVRLTTRLNERRKKKGSTQPISRQDVIRAILAKHAEEDLLLGNQLDPED